VKKCPTFVGARSWLRCDWSIYIIGRGLAKGELACLNRYNMFVYKYLFFRVLWFDFMF